MKNTAIAVAMALTVVLTSSAAVAQETGPLPKVYPSRSERCGMPTKPNRAFAFRVT